MSARELITDHLDLWTAAVTKKSRSGRGSNGKVELTGIKKLRDLILELAVRGKLVEQNTTDEPASELLERVKAEKLHLVEQGEIKKRSKLTKLSEMTTPFHLPPSWEWAQLEDLGRDWGQKAPSNEFSYIDVASVDNLRGTTTQPGILSAEEAPSRARKIVREGTLIYSTIRPYLQNIAVIESDIEPEPIASTAFAVLFPLAGMPARFFLHYLRSPAFVRYVESVQTGIAYPAINDKQFFSGLVPVPPLEEQHRIVQKVDELMALCDRMEQQTSDQLEAHETLVDTLLGTLTQSEDATELADNWARLAAHFDSLFTTEQSIDKLKQTILQLAVMGRLVEQDAGDVHAKELVATATQVREGLIQEGKLKRLKKSKIPNKDQSLPELPDGWSRVKVCELFQLQNGYAFKSSWFTEDGTRLLRNVNVSHGYIDWSDSVSLPVSMADEFARFELKKGDIVISLDRPLISTGLKYAVIRDCDVPCLLLQRVACFRPYSDIVHTGYLEYWLNSEMFTTSIDPGRSNGVPHISTGQIEALNFPLPPKEEQHRIVQKVDELMALCDQLKERLNQASETRCQLTEAAVEGALN